MHIDSNVEPAVRKVYAGAVAEEPERFESALADTAEQGEDFARACLVLAVTIDSVALFAIHDGQRPDDEQLRYLARAFCEAHRWAEIDEENASTFLTALADRRPLADVLPTGDVAEIAYVLGAWLLVAFLPEGKDWTDFLDEILDALESSPAP